MIVGQDERALRMMMNLAGYVCFTKTRLERTLKVVQDERGSTDKSL
jgi:hypothetical protein